MTMTRRVLFVALLMVTPAVLASDPTPLFVLFVEIPILGFSCLLLLLCFFAPKVGATLITINFFFSLLVMMWASNVGYMSTAGEFLGFSFVVDVIGLLLAAKLMSKVNNEETNENT